MTNTSDSDSDSITNFRQYGKSRTVRDHYINMYAEQSLAAVRNKWENYTKFDKAKMTMQDVLEHMDHYIDPSDPDLDIPNSVHAYQTAESARKLYPDREWLHLVGLIHDVGKILAYFGEPHHFVAGDTFPVGCQISDKCVHYSDINMCEYWSKPEGIYKTGCGLNKLLMSWGHDEYLYQVLKNYYTTRLIQPVDKLPNIALDIIRYHSFYPWHTSRAYQWAETQYDRDILLPAVLDFNKCDLYSKSNKPFVVTEEMKDYYTGLIAKYLPGVISW